MTFYIKNLDAPPNFSNFVRFLEAIIIIQTIFILKHSSLNLKLYYGR